MGGRGGSIAAPVASKAAAQTSVVTALAAKPIPTSAPQVQAPVAPPAPPMAPARPTPPVRRPPAGHSFPEMSQADQQRFLAEQRKLASSASRTASYQYMQDDAYRNGTPYSTGQNLNYAMATGARLTSAQQAMKDGLKQIMHPIGQQTTLYRMDHDAMLKEMGIRDYTRYTVAQLKQQLVGRTVQRQNFISTSHDLKLNPFAPGKAGGGGREVEMVIHTAPSARAAFVNASQAETLLDTDNHWRITNVRATGRTATPRGGGRRPVIALEVEVW
jgi:hypothetical protein